MHEPSAAWLRRGRPDENGAFADGGGDAFDGAAADVAGGEDAGAAGLEQEGLAFQFPVASNTSDLSDNASIS